jgi:two-component system, sensor histidine kinase and response regulator
VNVIELTGQRTAETFENLQRQQYARTDRLFAVLMAVQWVFGIVVATWVSPRTWVGAESTVHIHVWAAVFVGGIISAVPIMLAIMEPGHTATRHTIAVAQMLWSALLIHLTGGRIETHFHVFGSLAFLAIYRDWRVLVPATVVVAGDHLVRGIFWPQSVYGVLTASNWRFLEHAGWVVFEDVVLVWSCVRGTNELWRIAERTVSFEASEDRYRAVVHQSAEGILVFDAETGAILEHNPAFRRLLDIPESEVPTLRVDDELMPGSEALGEVIDALLREGTPLALERQLLRRNGTYLEIACSLTSTMYAGSRAVCVVIRDITERRRLDAELARARDSAIESARLKSEFLANMSHEIRTPMNGVVGMSGLLLETKLTDQQRDFAETIRVSADALLTIINDILDFSKVDAGELHFEMLDLDVRSAVEGTLDLLAEHADSKGLELASLVEAGVPSNLRGDPARIRQVLMNLVGNAIKFTEQGEVVVRASLDADFADAVMVRFEVTDTGIGISEDTQARLFQAFVQADGSTTRKYGGTGLGLAISKRLVTLMGGEIGVRSAPGAGSTFWFTARFQKQATSVHADAETTLAGRRVLIVDDNETNRKILQYQLSLWGVEHQAVPGAPEALRALRDAAAAGQPFELAILDRQMPVTDGVELARMIRRDGRLASVRMIMMTSLGDIGDSDELLAAGIETCMTKPVKQAQVHDCLARVLAETQRLGRQRAAESDETVSSPAPGTVRVLVAEDTAVNRKVALLQLKQLGYVADAVANGAEAIDALSRIPYDIILMDCQMPEVDGYEATRRIRSQGSRIPIIAMTAHAMKGDREKCLEAGMDDYIGKPIDKTALATVLAAWSPRPAALPEPAPAL